MAQSTSIKHKGWKWSTADASNPALVMVLDNTSKAVHITDASDASTDWNVSADSHPSVYIHSATTPATYYVKLYHDGTYGYLNVAGTTVFTSTTSALAVALATTFNSTVATTGLVTSTSTTGFRSNPTFVPDSTRTNYALCVGNRVTELSVTMAAATGQNFDPVQFNVNIIGSNPSATSTTNLIYANITHDTTDMAALRLKCADWNVVVAKNVLDAYVYQGEIDITASSAIGSEATVLGLVMNVSAGTVTGLVRGAVIAMIGSSMPAATSTALNINTSVPSGTMTLTNALHIDVGGSTTITNGIHIDGAVTNLLELDHASGFVTAGGTDCTASGATDPSYTLKIIDPAGAAGYIRVWAAA